MKLIQRHTIDEHADSIAHYLPGGRIFKNKFSNNTVLRRLLLGLAEEFARIENELKTTQDDYLPDNVTLFLPYWERALGIPDGCFSGTGSLEMRHRDVLLKLASLGVQTIADFQNLVSIFGVTATVYPGFDYDPGLPLNGKFHIVVEYENTEGFPYTFPIIFGGSAAQILGCLFQKLRPANCEVLFIPI